MAVVILADDGLAFTGAALLDGPLGGAETAFAELAAAFALRGHAVTAFTRGGADEVVDGVRWRPLADGVPDAADLYVANRSDRLLDRCAGARRAVFWVHNPARYLLKWRYQRRLWRRRPALSFTGAYHAGTYPRWGGGGARRVIPLGVSAPFLAVPPRVAPPSPELVFASNPERGLDRLLDLWSTRIRPAVPGATLTVHAGGAPAGRTARGARAAGALDRARSLAGEGVHLRPPLAKPALAAVLGRARAMVYPGDPNETFCLAVAEAQATGLPAVVGAIGALPERVADGRTGFVAPDEEALAAAATRVLTDDVLWWRMHEAALAARPGLGWDRVAAAWEDAFLPGVPG